MGSNLSVGDDSKISYDDEVSDEINTKVLYSHSTPVVPYRRCSSPRVISL